LEYTGHEKLKQVKQTRSTSAVILKLCQFATRFCYPYILWRLRQGIAA